MAESKDDKEEKEDREDNDSEDSGDGEYREGTKNRGDRDGNDFQQKSWDADDKNKKTKIETIKDVMPIFTPFIMIMGIAFTYYSYFYDVQKVPQLLNFINVEKVDETTDHYVLKISLRLENQSKSRVEIIANLGKLYGAKVNLIDTLDDEQFAKKIVDSLAHQGPEGFLFQKNMEIDELHLCGYFQPLHGYSWLQPEEVAQLSFVTAISKDFDLAIFTFEDDYATKRDDDIIVKYFKGKNNELTYGVYKMLDKDSTKLQEIELEDRLGDYIFSKTKIAKSGTRVDLWLRKDAAHTQATK